MNKKLENEYENGDLHRGYESRWPTVNCFEKIELFTYENHENSKHQKSNPKQITMTKTQNTKQANRPSNDR